jgi:adenine/guanine/hypoxanthine permease
MQLSKTREIISGLTTFAAMAHAFVIIPTLLQLVNVPFHEGLLTTVIITVFGSVLLGFIAKYPFAVAPSITLVAYSVYNLGLNKQLDWSSISTLTLCVGIIIVVLNFLGIRQRIFETVPQPLRLGVQTGLGLFLAVVGLFNAGVLQPNAAGFLTFPHVLEPPHVLFFLSLALMIVFYTIRLYGGFLLAILITWVISFHFGLTGWNYGFHDLPFNQIPKQEFAHAFFLSWKGAEELFSLLLVVLFDTSGALYALSQRGGYLEPCEGGKTVPRISALFFADGFATALAGLIGGGLPSMYLSSIAGIESGGKTGKVAILVGCLALLTLFFLPILSSIPLFATAAVFVIIGGSLLSSFKDMDWQDPSSWIPGVLTFICIPYTMSVAQGVGIGYLSFVLLKLSKRKFDQINRWTWLFAALFAIKFTFLPFG